MPARDESIRTAVTALRRVILMNTRTDCLGFFIALTVGLSLPAPLFADDQQGLLANRSGTASKPDDDSYRSFSGKRAGDVRDDNALKMKFVWCILGSFRMGPIQIVAGKRVNENQHVEDLHRRLVEQERAAQQPAEVLHEDDFDDLLVNVKKDEGHTDQIVSPKETVSFLTADTGWGNTKSSEQSGSS